MTDDQLIDQILVWEGGYADMPGDPGGATIWGLSQGAQTDLLGHPPTPEETRAITKDQAREYYRAKFVAPFSWILDDALRTYVVDGAVLDGVGWTTRALQTLVGVVVDGVIGPKTRLAVSAADPRTLLAKLIYRRVDAEIRSALSDVAPGIVHTTRLQALSGWWRRSYEVGVRALVAEGGRQ